MEGEKRFREPTVFLVLGQGWGPWARRMLGLRVRDRCTSETILAVLEQAACCLPNAPRYVHAEASVEAFRREGGLGALLRAASP